jgi:hypothetical protein
VSRHSGSFIETPPGGPNFGRKRTFIMAEGYPRVSQSPLDEAGLVGDDFTSPADPSNPPPWGAGVGIVAVDRGTGAGFLYGAAEAGMVAHRGVLHSDEHVDPDALRAEMEEALGFTYADVSAAYKNGRPTAEQRQLRDKIDARLLALSRAGGNMALFARVFGVSEKTLDRALVRAKLAHVKPMVATGVVRTPRACFVCESTEATPRKRRFSKSPPVWTGTIDLCDPCHVRGYEEETGNPVYWEFRRPGSPVTEARAAESRERVKRLLAVGA